MPQKQAPPQQLAHELIEHMNSEHHYPSHLHAASRGEAERAALKPATLSDDGFPERERGHQARGFFGSQAVTPQVAADLRSKSDGTDH